MKITEKYYYDHELIEIKNAEYRSLPGTTGVDDESASTLNIIQNRLFSTGFDKENSKNLEFSRKRLHQQINPIVRDGKVRDEYADLLANKEYTPTTLKGRQDTPDRPHKRYFSKGSAHYTHRKFS